MNYRVVSCCATQLWLSLSCLRTHENQRQRPHSFMTRSFYWLIDWFVDQDKRFAQMQVSTILWDFRWFNGVSRRPRLCTASFGCKRSCEVLSRSRRWWKNQKRGIWNFAQLQYHYFHSCATFDISTALGNRFLSIKLFKRWPVIFVFGS